MNNRGRGPVVGSSVARLVRAMSATHKHCLADGIRRARTPDCRTFQDAHHGRPGVTEIGFTRDHSPVDRFFSHTMPYPVSLFLRTLLASLIGSALFAIAGLPDRLWWIGYMTGAGAYLGTEIVDLVMGPPKGK